MENLYCGRGQDKDNKKLIDFLDEVFFKDWDSEENFFEMLPKIYKDEYRPAFNNFVIQDKNGDFRSAIGAFYNQFSVGGEDISACCIGNVAVGKEHRSKGYMKKLMELCLNDMIKNNTAIAYLGGQRQRYAYFGFESAGTRYIFSENPQTVKHSFNNAKSSLSCEKLSPDDKESISKILEINNSLPIHAIRTPENCFDVLCSWTCTPYVLKKDGEFAGYFTLTAEQNKSVQECGVAKLEYLQDLAICALETANVQDLNFHAGEFEKEKIKFFTENFENISATSAEAVLIFDFEKIIRSYLKAKTQYTELCDGEMTVLIHGVNGDEKLRISVKNNVSSVEKSDGKADFELSHLEATRAFFSLFFADRADFPPCIKQWLPLPIYFNLSDTM